VEPALSLDKLETLSPSNGRAGLGSTEKFVSEENRPLKAQADSEIRPTIREPIGHSLA